MAYTLFGANVSPFVRKCRAYLAEKGIPYTHESVNPFQPPSNFRQLSPLGRIPALLDDDRPVADSTAICLYLERCHPEPALYPADNYEYAHALWIEEYIDSGFTPVAGPGVFRPLVLGPVAMNQPLTRGIKEDALEVVENQISPMWDYLERQLGAQQFFVGGRLSIADLAVASGHVNLWHAGVDPDPHHWPKLTAYLAGMWARPSFAALIAEEQKPWNRREAIAAV
jgi:glutathione S-transferase